MLTTRDRTYKYNRCDLYPYSDLDACSVPADSEPLSYWSEIFTDGDRFTYALGTTRIVQFTTPNGVYYIDIREANAGEIGVWGLKGVALTLPVARCTVRLLNVHFFDRKSTNASYIGGRPIESLYSSDTSSPSVGSACNAGPC